jgi:hypothetical protein
MKANYRAAKKYRCKRNFSFLAKNATRHLTVDRYLFALMTICKVYAVGLVWLLGRDVDAKMRWLLFTRLVFATTILLGRRPLFPGALGAWTVDCIAWRHRVRFGGRECERCAV